MRSPADRPVLAGWSGSGTGAQQLAAASSFGDAESLRLPFNLQRRQAFLFALAVIAMAAVAIAAGVKPELGIGVVAAVAVAFAVALNDMVGLVLLAALAASTSGLGKGVPIPGFRVSELLIGGVGIILLASARRYVRWTTVDWLAVLYSVATLGLGAWDMLKLGQPFGLGEIELLLGPFQFFLLYRATVVTARTPERRRLALRLMFFASVPVSLLALGQQFDFPGVRSLIVSLTGNNVYAGGATARVTGPFPLWHNLGGYLLLLLLTMVAVRMRGVRDVLSDKAMIAIAILDVAALIETLDITPILALIAGVLIIGVWLGGFNRVLLGLAAAIIIAFLIFGSRIDARFNSEFGHTAGQSSSLVPATVQYRVDLWTSELLPLLKGHVATGYGPNLPPQLADFPYTESQYVNLLYRGGVTLLVVWAALLISMGLAGVRSTHDESDPLQRALGATVATVVICLIFMQIVEAYFVDDGTPQVLWMLLGLLTFHQLPSPRLIRRQPPTEQPLVRRAWASQVAMASGALDPSSRELLDLTYRRDLPTHEVVAAMGLTPRALTRWRQAALGRLADLANTTPAEVEAVLRTNDYWRDAAPAASPTATTSS